MKQFAELLLAVCIMVLNSVPILAHGVRIDHIIDAATGEITVTAAFDSGEVLDGAAVVIFAPDDLINPWSTGVMDENGSYSFMPDYTIEGFWDIQVRKAGHGGLISVEISADMMPDPLNSAGAGNSSTITLSDGSQVVITSSTRFVVEGDTVIFQTAGATSTPQPVSDTQLASGFTTGQIIIMSLSVIWGLIGTALYFTKRKPALKK
jgi:nickel transport protein